MARYTSEHEELLALRKSEREALREKPVRKKSDGPTPAEAREAKELKDPEIRAHLKRIRAERERDWNPEASTRQSRVIKVYKHAGYMINVKALPDDQVAKLDKRFTHTVYDEKACEKCEFLEDRHGENCDNCASFQGHRVLTKRVELGDETMLSIPYGATDHLKKFLARTGREFKIINRHPPDTPLSRPIRLAKGCELRPYQREAVDVILSKRKGMIEAPPRSGKTFLSAAAIAEIGQKTLILASQRDWLMQFQETFVGSETSPAMTTCKAHQVKFCRTLKDFLDTDICLATFQQFMNPAGRRLLKRISSLFPVVVVDECFTKDHEVLTTTGYVPIDKLAADWSGVSVVSHNHQTGLDEPQPVISSRSKTVTRLVKIRVDGVDFKCTLEHPIWSETRACYVKAQDILPGERVLLKGT